MRTSNPAFNENLLGHFDYASPRSTVMTVQGTVAKSLLLLTILMATAGWTWVNVSTGEWNPAVIFAGFLGGAILAFVTIFWQKAAPWTSPFYAALEGVALGGVSYFIDQKYPGIAIQAVMVTGMLTFIMLFLYGTRMIQVTGKVAGAIVACTGALCLVYILSMVLSLFGTTIPFIHSAGPIGIAFSVFVVGLAAFNLLLDFDFIERGAEYNLPKYMEWYGAFGLMLTLVWLYMEVLRLLRKLQDR